MLQKNAVESPEFNGQNDRGVNHTHDMPWLKESASFSLTIGVDSFGGGGHLMGWLSRLLGHFSRQRCPVCLAAVTANARYPRYVCLSCAGKAAAADGQRVVFYNEDMSGGCYGKYADTGEPYPSRECFIGGVRCHADEARFGGIVIEAVQ